MVESNFHVFLKVYKDESGIAQDYIDKSTSFSHKSPVYSDIQERFAYLGSRSFRVQPQLK